MDQDYDRDQSEFILSTPMASISHVGLSPHLNTCLLEGSKRCRSLSKTLLTLTFPRVIYISNIISNVD